MAGELTGCLGVGFGDGADFFDFAVFLEFFLGDGTGAVEVEDGFFAIARFDGDDGAFESLAACAGIDDEWDAAIEFLEDGGGRGGGDAAEAVGAGGCEW